MKNIDSIGLKVCSFQANLFEASITKTNCSSGIFIRRFMNSDLAKIIDKGGLLFDSISISDSIEEIENQYGNSQYGSEKYSIEQMHWIGYIYRYWAYISGKSSRQLYKAIKPNVLRKLYFPYHSLDPHQAIERIIEDFNISNDNNISDIEKGVIALRKIRANLS